jgi:hypothetical protein
MILQKIGFLIGKNAPGLGSSLINLSLSFSSVSVSLQMTTRRVLGLQILFVEINLEVGERNFLKFLLLTVLRGVKNWGRSRDQTGVGE